ncbi:hypothetical protein K457DRAFT_747104 [Linnemannia elongata AG-77]|uniref:Uncharacterized protein n=1 Tax=Linnemannia elongata AG-77 TaxID=1314771 RepID=A0A197JMB3_9FUNG|nr:hypothetical protein K457DRAFT_747104 [Linnemannia elongata AG-77]
MTLRLLALALSTLLLANPRPGTFIGNWIVYHPIDTGSDYGFDCGILQICWYQASTFSSQVSAIHLNLERRGDINDWEEQGLWPAFFKQLSLQGGEAICISLSLRCFVVICRCLAFSRGSHSPWRQVSFTGHRVWPITKAIFTMSEARPLARGTFI